MTVNIDDLWGMLTYEPDTGWFRWTTSRGGKIAGDRAGYSRKGYWWVKIGGRQYQAANLAWFFMTGRWTLVDHRNLDRGDNRWSNLRETTPSLNVANQRGRSVHGKGVYPAPTPGRWIAKIRGKHIGTFADKETAAAAFAYAAADDYGEFMRL